MKAQGEQAIGAYQAEHRLAYLAEVPVNWCPRLGTVLSNEEVTNEGRSDRGNHPVYRRPMRQWMLRITEYAERLLADLDLLDWPESIKLMQRNWIGRSEGAYVDFAIEGDGPAAGNVIRVFTTRPDTLYGATYMVLAPEHRLVQIITTPEQRDEVRAYVAAARSRSPSSIAPPTPRTKTGVFTGAYAINPVNRRQVPIWVADYVLISYGTGSIMAVPGHDTRDLEFAETYRARRRRGRAIRRKARTGAALSVTGVAVNSPPDAGAHFTGQCVFNGTCRRPKPSKSSPVGSRRRICGEGTIQYKLRDWLFSRQRYWGEPFPILYRPDGVASSLGQTTANLPVTLPEMEDFRPHASDDPNAEPQTPLTPGWPIGWRSSVTARRCAARPTPCRSGRAHAGTTCVSATHRTNKHALIDPEVERYWMGSPGPDGKPKAGGVDLYIGGAEHAVLHLLYARFWHKVLYDLHHVSTPEPFHKLFNQGMIQSYTYRDSRGMCVGHDQVELRGEEAYHKETGQKLSATVEKMSKSLKNVINPDAIIVEYGADTLRLYEMYMGPLEKDKPWNTHAIIGMHRFLQDVWRLIVPKAVDGQEAPPPLSPRIQDEQNEELERLLHQTIKKVTGDIERFAYNTAIAQMRVWANEAARAKVIGRNQLERFVLLLAPFAPHTCEELWQRLGHAESLAREPWPEYVEALTRAETVELAVQVNDKLRDRVTVPADATEEQILTAALGSAKVAKEVAGREIRRTVVVKGRLVNLIV